MEQLFKFIIDKTAQGSIEKETAIQMVKLLKQTETKEVDDIAIIGMAGKMPLADSIDQYWDNIQHGIDCITPLPETRHKDLTDYLRFIETPEAEIKFNENGFIENIDTFDYQFFRLSLKEATLMDPHQRLFLQTVWEAIEDAGYGGKKLVGTNTGVYAGFASNLRDLYIKQIYDVEPTALPLSMVGNLSAVLPSRISYLLDLRGPSMLIDTACSSSLVSITLACEAIRNGKCDMAIAGGVKLNVLPLDSEYMRIGIESIDGRTRAFHDESNGSAIGEGVAAVLLKPLKKALKDGDNIYAVIKGCAMNQDGNSVGLTAPNPAAQTDVIVKAWEDARVQPETISYIETHGTGTKLGDPIEIKGIHDAFTKFSVKKQSCAIGSVKTNVGHSSEAAGILSLIKVVMALRHKKLPPSLYFNRPNRTIPLADSPVYVNTTLRDWEVDGMPRRAGVSSFGISGTNCHVVIEEAPVQERPQPTPQPAYVLSLSAMNEASLEQLVEKYREKLVAQPDTSLVDICYTTHTGRGHYHHRLAIVCQDRDDLLQKLANPNLLTQQQAGVYYGTFKVIGSNKPKQNESDITEQEKAELCRTSANQMQAWLAADGKATKMLHDLCHLYTKGADVEWDKLYPDITYQKVSLPAYPFQQTRCWIDIPETVREESRGEEEFFYHMVWNEQPAIEETEQPETAYRTVLLFKDETGIAEQIASELTKQNATVLTVTFGETYQHNEDGSFVLSGSEEEYGKLLSTIKEGDLSHVIHLAAITGADEITQFADLQVSQQKGVYALFYLVRALVNHGHDRDLRVSVLADYVYNVTGNEPRINPEHAPLFGLGKAANQEHPGIRIRCLDMDETTSVADIMQEMNMASETYQVARRNGKRYSEEFKEVYLDNVADEPVTIRENGVYLITGGTGGIGLELARDLALKNKVHLALISRSRMPERAEWDDIVQSGEHSKLCKQIESIRSIEELGTTITCYAANIADEAQMQQVVTAIRAQHGAIHGVIHAAGIPGDGFLFKKEQAAFDQVFYPKVYGTWVLHQVTKEEPLDFFIMFSSGLSLLSEPGHGDYTAANSYLDSFATYRSREQRKTLTINWTTWKETGMAVDYGFNYDTVFKAISTETAIDKLYEVLGKNINRVLIGEFSYMPQFLFLLDRLPFKLSDNMRAKSDHVLREKGLNKNGGQERRVAKKAGKVELKGKENQQFSDIEMKVAQIYNEVLGYSEINIDDSFFELGGDSVMLNRMHAILDQEFPHTIKLIDLFNQTTVAALSHYISSKLEPRSQPTAVDTELDDLADMLEELEKGTLSIDDAMKNLR